MTAVRLVRTVAHPSWCEADHSSGDRNCYRLPDGISASRYPLRLCIDSVRRPQAVDVGLFEEADGRLTIDMVVPTGDDVDEADVHLTLREAEQVAARLMSLVAAARAAD